MRLRIIYRDTVMTTFAWIPIDCITGRILSGKLTVKQITLLRTFRTLAMSWEKSREGTSQSRPSVSHYSRSPSLRQCSCAFLSAGHAAVSGALVDQPTFSTRPTLACWLQLWLPILTRLGRWIGLTSHWSTMQSKTNARTRSSWLPWEGSRKALTSARQLISTLPW